MTGFRNPRLRLDVDGDVALASDLYELVDDAFTTAAVTDYMIEFDLLRESDSKVVHVRVMGDTPRAWLVESIQNALSRAEYEDAWVGPYPRPGESALGAIAIHARVGHANALDSERS